MNIKSIKGFHDILPKQSKRWQFVESKAKTVFELYGFSELRIPVLEFTEIYQTGIGDNTDIVSKEMYTFEDRDGSSITLRPEGTAGIVRSFIENSFHKKSPINKFYYIGPMFRHERPQKGRYRGFNQIGAELFGSDSPTSDAEVITMLWQFFSEIGFENSLELELNSIGDTESRENFKRELSVFLKPKKRNLCKDCIKKLDYNPLRILDCKNPYCEEIVEDGPKIIEHLNKKSSQYFKELCEILDSLSVPFKINHQIVRGLDYYSETVFEMTTNALGSQNAVAAGGRYNNLVERFGGPQMPAIGFAIGTERVILIHEAEFQSGFEPEIDVFIAWIGQSGFDAGFKLAKILREKKNSVEIDYEPRSLKSQLKKADKLKAKYAIIVGEDEIKKGITVVRDMKLGSEQEVELKNINKIIVALNTNN